MDDWQKRAEKDRRDRERRAIQQERERQARFDQMERDRQKRLDQMERDRQERLRRLELDRQERLNRLQHDQERRERDRQRYQERQERDRQKIYDRLEHDRHEREKAYQETLHDFYSPHPDGKVSGIFNRFFGRHVKTEGSRFDDLGFTFGSKTFDDLLSEIYAQPQTQPTPETVLSPAEQTRQRLMTTLPADVTKTLETHDETNVRGFIATVYKARQVNPDRTDWDIYIAYRRSIEVETPDPAMVEKTQIAGLLLEGSRSEAKFPF